MFESDILCGAFANREGMNLISEIIVIDVVLFCSGTHCIDSIRVLRDYAKSNKQVNVISEITPHSCRPKAARAKIASDAHSQSLIVADVESYEPQSYSIKPQLRLLEELFCLVADVNYARRVVCSWVLAPYSGLILNCCCCLSCHLLHLNSVHMIFWTYNHDNGSSWFQAFEELLAQRSKT